jgi:hypothetical protein
MISKALKDSDILNVSEKIADNPAIQKEDESFNFENVEFGENEIFPSLQEKPEPPEMEEPEIPEPQIKEPEPEKKENKNYEDYTPEAWERIKKLQQQIKDIRH